MSSGRMVAVRTCPLPERTTTTNSAGVINKMIRLGAGPPLNGKDATDKQLEFPLLYAVGRDRIASKTLDVEGKNLHVLFDTILHMIPGPSHDPRVSFLKN